MKHSLIYLVTMGKFFLMKDDMKGQHYAMYKKEKQYLYLQALFDDLQITLKRNASSATAELLFHF